MNVRMSDGVSVTVDAARQTTVDQHRYRYRYRYQHQHRHGLEYELESQH
ncbi:hypothetical protein OB955_02785 [Halobacteria archaeon AArc-m2/3/4]|uniref:Uncharacterized protein n=1 Tax=Natronoglomus mannanivorans TaxID=2979990 RepID=A0ABT2Q9Q4_9EURY|nr:hypothetical protein [Halobacteria archaeon AArc-m2/3/4]